MHQRKPILIGFYVRPGNTGVAGDYHHTITGDRFGNIWTGGYMPFWSDGSCSKTGFNRRLHLLG
jgi:hypothetical protein